MITSWSCYGDNLKECYGILKANPNITLKEYLKVIDWGNRDTRKYNIYTYDGAGNEKFTDN